MSIAILKRKSNLKQKGVSKGPNGFSLNGYRRLNSSSLVGASLHARRRNYTPMKGAAIRANGSHCCGNYDKNVISANKLSTVDNIVKPSVVSTKGMLSNKLRACTYGSYPGYVVKNMDQLDYERYLQNKTGSVGSCVSMQLDAGIKQCYDNCPTNTHHYVKDVATKNQGDYLKADYLKNKCVLSIPTGESNVYLNSYGVITSGPSVFVTGGSYTFHFTIGDVVSISGASVISKSSYTLKMPSLTPYCGSQSNLVIVGSNNTKSYTIFNTGGSSCN